MDKILIITGLGYGDEGKGSITDYLTRLTKARLVVRHNGGAQCGHNVVLSDGRHHTFAQLGSGTFVPGVETHLSRFVIVNPSSLQVENDALKAVGVADALERLSIDGRALLTTQWHIRANRARESARAASAHGTCGMGIGETVAWSLAAPGDALRAADLQSPATLADKMAVARSRFEAEFGAVPEKDVTPARWGLLASRLRITSADESAALLAKPGTVIFEGAQGVLLDETYGFHPHTTWTDTTFKNATELAIEAGAGAGAREMRRIGVIRSYMTRHGAGPLVTESALSRPEPHNTAAGFQGAFRTGELDFPALNYALRCAGGVTELAVTHMDVVPDHVCLSYDRPFRPDAEYLAKCRPVFTNLRFHNQSELLDVIESELGARVSITSWGPTPSDKRTR